MVMEETERWLRRLRDPARDYCALVEILAEMITIT